MNLNHFNKHKQIKENSFVWRYMSYFKLYDFLGENAHIDHPIALQTDHPKLLFF